MAQVKKLELTNRESIVLMQCLNTRQDENFQHIKECRRLRFDILLAKYLQDNHDIESIRHKVSNLEVKKNGS